MGQKCIAVIERKVLIVLLFANASDYSNKTCIFVRYKHIIIPVHVHASLVQVVTCVCEEQYD